MSYFICNASDVDISQPEGYHEAMVCGMGGGGEVGERRGEE